jgi:hypothetical protein
MTRAAQASRHSDPTIVRVLAAAFAAEATAAGWRPTGTRYARIGDVLEAGTVLVRSLAAAA